MRTGLFAMNCCNVYERAYPKKFKTLCQSIFAILEQCAHLSLTEVLLNLAAALMCLHKDMNFVEGPRVPNYDEFQVFHRHLLYEFPDMIQYTWRQYTTRI